MPTRAAFPARCLAIALFAAVACAAEPVLAPFADGETVAFLGDSITHDGRWHRCIADFYATRFPDRRIVFINAGLSGDTTGGALGRLDADVLAWKPTTVVSMLGMNDCGRDAYKPGSDGDAVVKGIRERCLTTYHDNQVKLAARLAAVARQIVVTPTPYEDTATLPAANLPGANAALGRATDMLMTLAQGAKTGLVDFHGPMTALDLERQRADPAFTLVGADRVHPGSPGHLVMAWLLLKSQGVPALVSRTVIDAQAKTATAENAGVSGPAFATGEITYTLAAKALPFPITTDARPALAWTSIEADLDREELVIAGLAEGQWRIEIDGTAVLSCTAAELGAGVNLALITKTPQYLQALKVQMLNEERRALEHRLRGVAMVEFRMFKPGEVDFGDPAKAAAAIEQRLATNPAAFLRKMLEAYHTDKPEVPALRAKILAMSESIRQAAQPKPRRYRIVKVP